MPKVISRSTPDALLSRSSIRFVLQTANIDGTGGSQIAFELGLPHVDQDGANEEMLWVRKTLAAAVQDTALTAAERTALLALLAKLRNFYRTAEGLDP